MIDDRGYSTEKRHVCLIKNYYRLLSVDVSSPSGIAIVVPRLDYRYVFPRQDMVRLPQLQVRYFLMLDFVLTVGIWYRYRYHIADDAGTVYQYLSSIYTSVNLTMYRYSVLESVGGIGAFKVNTITVPVQTVSDTGTKRNRRVGDSVRAYYVYFCERAHTPTHAESRKPSLR